MRRGLDTQITHRDGPGQPPARGVTVEELAAEILTDNVPEVGGAPRRRHLSFAGIGASKHGISHQVDELLADGFGSD